MQTLIEKYGWGTMILLVVTIITTVIAIIMGIYAVQTIVKSRLSFDIIPKFQYKIEYKIAETDEYQILFCNSQLGGGNILGSNATLNGSTITLTSNVFSTMGNIIYFKLTNYTEQPADVANSKLKFSFGGEDTGMTLCEQTISYYKTTAEAPSAEFTSTATTTGATNGVVKFKIQNIDSSKVYVTLKLADGYSPDAMAWTLSDGTTAVSGEYEKSNDLSFVATWVGNGYGFYVSDCRAEGDLVEGAIELSYPNGITDNIYTSVIIFKFVNCDLIGESITLYVAYYAPCVAKGTLVLVQNENQEIASVPIEEVGYDTKVLTWDFYKGEFAFETCAVFFDYGTKEYEILELVFNDGTTVEVIGYHQFFDLQTYEFEYITCETVHKYVGHHFLKIPTNEDGVLTKPLDGVNSFETVILKDYRIYTKNTGCYSVHTAYHFNSMANGLFSMAVPDLVQSIFRIFDIERDMTFNQTLMEQDIATYGLWTYEESPFVNYVTSRQFYELGAEYMAIPVGKNEIEAEFIIGALNLFILPHWENYPY